MCLEGRKWNLSAVLFADDAVLLAESEEQLLGLGNVFEDFKYCSLGTG